MKWSNRHDREKAPRSALLGSVTVHGAVAVLAAILALSSGPAMEPFETIQLELVSLPASRIADIDQPAVQPEELQVETPDPVPLEEPPPLPDPEAPPVQQEPPPDSVKPKPVETPKPEEILSPPDSTVTEVTPPTRADSTVTETSETGEDIEVRMEGVKRDFPAYYANIIGRIRQCFRPPNTNRRDLSAVVYFVIKRDGTVSDLRMVEESGVAMFDISALSAIGDCAGTGRFGPLPEDLGYETLPIQFEFTPGRDQAPTSQDRE